MILPVKSKGVKYDNIKWDWLSFGYLWLIFLMNYLVNLILNNLCNPKQQPFYFIKERNNSRMFFFFNPHVGKSQ